MGRISCFIAAIFGTLLVHYAAAQKVYVVGDGLGWAIPPNTSVSYSNWASARTFTVGDILVFNFVTGQHNVLQVPQASYDACTQDNAIGGIISTGPANITLDSAGNHYYICTFGRHCQAGQKLAITVGSSTPGGANPPRTTPPPTTTQPGACAPTPSTPNPRGRPTVAITPSAAPPPTDSAAPSLAGSFLFILLSAGVALTL